MRMNMFAVYKTKPYKVNIRGLNLAAVKLTTFQVTKLPLLYNKAWTNSGLTNIAKGRIFDNTLHMRYVHLKRAKQNLFIRDKPILSSDRMLHEDYGRKGSIVKKKISGREPRGAWS
jgi:hypothetical protein